MDVAADTPRSASYKQTFRRHRLLLSLPMVLATLVAGFFAVTAGKSFRSYSTLWVDTAPPTQSSVGVSATPLPTTPAAAEQSILSELLSTHSFVVSVAQHSLLGKWLGSAAAIRRHAGDRLSTSTVTATVAGPQILKISYTGPSAAISRSTMAAIVRELTVYSSGLSAQHNRAALSYDQALVRGDTAAVALARRQVTAYLAHHPRSTPGNDPNLAPLVAAENAASTQLAQANGDLGSAESPINDSGWLVHVIDPASAGLSLAPGKKKILAIVLGGLLAGALISFLGTVALTPAKRDPWEEELLSGSPRRSGYREDVPHADDLGDPRLADHPLLMDSSQFLFDSSGVARNAP